MAKKSKENKQMLELGDKKRAGQLISSYLRAIGTEKTESTVVFTDPDSGKSKIISKAEMLARDIWEQALNGTDNKTKLEYRKLLLDRIEGRPEVGSEDVKQKRGSIPDRVSEVNRDRLNELAKMGENESKKM